ncbi:nucleotidyltransferase domain-containing protein [Candidatus Pacearchaeota archaeon]|nr:nucleotidyltransferase domain-containing protein [Candidatus Pacearchaeota archaeon]
MKPTVINKNYKLLIETGNQRIMEILFRFPDREFSLSELAKLSKVAKTNVGLMLENLQKLDFIEITKLSNLWRIKANQRNWGFIKSKIVYNLNFVYQSGLVEFLIGYFKNPKSIILFGSFGKGEDMSNSDIDIAIENDETKSYEIIGLRELSEFEKAIDRKIQIHIFNRKEIDIHVFNNIANGIVLFGFLEVKK